MPLVSLSARLHHNRHRTHAPVAVMASCQSQSGQILILLTTIGQLIATMASCQSQFVLISIFLIIICQLVGKLALCSIGRVSSLTTVEIDKSFFLNLSKLSHNYLPDTASHQPNRLFNLYIWYTFEWPLSRRMMSNQYLSSYTLEFMSTMSRR